jgi:hypothetical protein
MLVELGDHKQKMPSMGMSVERHFGQQPEKDKRMGERQMNTFKAPQRERGQLRQEVEESKTRGKGPIHTGVSNLSKRALREDKHLTEASYSGFDMVDREQFLEIALNSIEIPRDLLAHISKKLSER